MAFDDPTRSRLARFVGKCRDLLSEEFTRQLQSIYGIDPETGEVAAIESLSLTNAERETARLLRETMEHYLASLATSDSNARIEVLDRIVREQAFTVLNRLCALRMAEARGLLIESISKGYQSKGFQLYLQLAGTALGERGNAYRCFLLSLFDEFAVDLPVLFDRFSPQGRLFPRDAALLVILGEINHAEIDPLWAEDETIGWIYQYFNSIEERKAMRAASQAPRNSRELAVRNQFFTPRYVVEFLTDNTLGRIWYEMTKGQTGLKNSCRYLVRRPTEIFLAEGEEAPEQEEAAEDLSQEELLKQPVYIPHRPLKDPRDIKMLDPACGSMHFGLYAFDLFERIYEEAWDLEAEHGADGLARPEGLKPLQETYASKDEFLRDVPRLVIERNIHGIDIDPRAVQIAGLSLWLRAQKSWQARGLAPQDRPQIERSNIVCAEPMPGEEDMLEEFLAGLRNDRLESLIRRVLDVPENQQVRATARMAEALCDLVRTVWKEMELAGEAGSLLKIEESLADAIAKGKEEWEEKFPLFRVQEFGLGQLKPKTSYVKFIPGEENDFWNRAEVLVLAALEDYAEHAQDAAASRRQMFARDAAKGFAFIDLCRKRFDAVLMNPPFGLAPRRVFDYLKKSYPDTYVDLYACFAARGLEVAPTGLVGAITSRAFIMTKKLDRWRMNELVSAIDLLLDLGIGVMDDAFVEAAAYILRRTSFIPVLIASDRRHADVKSGPMNMCGTTSLYIVARDQLSTLPGAKLLYQLPIKVFSLLRSPESFEPRIGTAREGLRTFDDVRFLRLRWEVCPHNIGPRRAWEPLAKGGEYARYYSDIHLHVKWNCGGHELAAVNLQVNGQVAQSRQASDYYRKAGATYSKRSAKGFSARALPAGCIIGTKGPAVLSESEVVPALILGWLNCALVRNLIHIQANAYEFNTGIIKRLPWRVPDRMTQLARVVTVAVKAVRDAKRLDEANSCFESPMIGDSIATMAAMIASCRETAAHAVAESDRQWDHAMIASYGIGLFGVESDVDDLDEGDDEDRTEGDEAADADTAEEAARGLVAYAIGCVFARWDIRKALGTHKDSRIPEPFEALPACSPGMLLGDDGLPLDSNRCGDDYPMKPCWPGVLACDKGVDGGIVEGVRAALDIIWGNHSGEIEQEIVSHLGGSLGNYLNNPVKFFDDHLRTYSKSRRYAPIYWPLSIPSGSYMLWLYYHRLTDQTLYTCVNDFVDSKLKQVAEEASKLRGKPNRSSADEKELEQLTDLEGELKDFCDEMLRIAKFWKPNLNDGVQITAAPLWKLFQHKPWQKRLKETWEKLEAGEYDWAHLALSIWPDRVVRASHKDRSYAIAHDLEDQLWEEVEVEKKTRGGKVKKKMEWRPRELSEHQLNEIVAEVKAR